MCAADIKRHPSHASAVSQVHGTAIADGCNQSTVDHLCLHLLDRTFTGTRTQVCLPCMTAATQLNLCMFGKAFYSAGGP